MNINFLVVSVVCTSWFVSLNLALPIVTAYMNVILHVDRCACVKCQCSQCC